ncbi:MAG: coiled coil domain-containing protein [Gammaproteobacteria bacterium]|nr:coiled coil domain-containing protein [Gammaproteobacteria bacterium]
MESKKAYQERMEAELREWQARIDVLKAKADKAQADQKLEYQEEIESVRAKQQQVRERMKELQDAGADAWQEVKAGLDAAWEDMRSAADRALERFK